VAHREDWLDVQCKLTVGSWNEEGKGQSHKRGAENELVEVNGITGFVERNATLFEEAGVHCWGTPRLGKRRGETKNRKTGVWCRGAGLLKG